MIRHTYDALPSLEEQQQDDDDKMFISRNYFSRICYSFYCGRRCRRLGILFLILFLLFLIYFSWIISYLPYSFLSFESESESDCFYSQGNGNLTAMRTLIIIDAGSSGSRLYIYAWHAMAHLARLPRFKLLWSIQISPGK